MADMDHVNLEGTEVCERASRPTRHRAARLAGAVLAAVGLVVAVPSSAQASTLFVQPTPKAAGVDLGSPNANDGSTASFTVLVPDDFQSFTRATVVTVGNGLIPIRDRSFVYSLHIAISQNQQRQGAFTNDLWNLPGTANPSTTLELNASAIFPNDLHAGVDVVTLDFKALPNTTVKVVGLRFEFVGGTVGPPGPAGPGGPTAER